MGSVVPARMNFTPVLAGTLIALAMVAPGVPRAWAAPPPPEDGADSLSIEACVALAREQAPALRAARLDRAAAASDSASVAANARPGFSVNAGALVAPRGFYDPTLTNLGDYELKLGMDWTALDGGRRSRARARSGLELSAARWRLAFEAREAGLRAAELALRLLRLQQGAAARQLGIDWLDRLGSLVRSGVIAGVRGSSDSIRVALERDAALADFESMQLETNITTLELLGLMGRDPDTRLVILEPAPAFDRAPTAADSLRLIGSVEQLPEIGIARTAEAQGRLDLMDAQRRGASTVEVTVDAGLAGADLTRAVPDNLRADDPGATFGDRVRRDLGASAAVHFHLPVLDRSARPGRQAREAALGAARVRSDAEALAQQRRAVELLAQWRTASHQLQAAQQTSERAERNLLKLKSLYSAGATTLLDLLDARRVYDDARERLAAARQENRMAQFQVEDRK